MVRKSTLFTQALIALPLLSAGSAALAHAQATPRITGQVESSALMSIPNQVHPWARAQFDRGPAPAGTRGRMLLTMKRSPEQESALQSLLASQQDPHSPNFHKWITPEQFGAKFGVADSDMQTVAGYLASQGISVGRVYGNHMALELTATTDQIRSTFQTEIHAYSVSGKTFYANNSAPKVPSALSKVVTGFASLNDFHAVGGSGAGAQATLDPKTHVLKPLLTINNGLFNQSTFGVTPADLATIYSIPAATGQGQGGANVNVGVIGDSNINVNYINQYRSVFGLSAKTPIVVVDGNDPGINDDAYIAYKQIELIGAVAPNANIYYYTSADTDYDTGLNFAFIRAVEDNQVQVLVNGFQTCETAIGGPGMALINQLVEQAAAQGITVVAAAGNTGSTGCEIPGSTALATSGTAVNGYATSPFLTAVGGTDFYYSGLFGTGTYWGAANSSTGASALQYIPEQAWNDSYDINISSDFGASVLLAGGGGPSTAGLDGVSTPQPIPSYQTGNTAFSTISKTARIIPDVSFFAGSGANNSEGYNYTAYVFCMKTTDCQSGINSQFTFSGGTEASSAVFAGAVALAVQQYNSGTPFGLGNVNPTLYAQLANGTILGTDVAAGKGNNETLCSAGTNCNTRQGRMNLYATAKGYDAATGLGSFFISSFVAKYKPSNTATSNVTLTVTNADTGKPLSCLLGGVLTPNCAVHSSNIALAVAVTGTNPTGDVAIYTTSPLAADQAVEVMTLANGKAVDPANQLLPGGTYQVYARYAGDGTNAPSVSAPYTLTLTPEPCAMVVYGNNVASGPTMPYGSPVMITAEPYSLDDPAAVAIPSGSLSVVDTFGGSARTITTLPLNSEGAATFSSNLLAFGTHSIRLNFGGDASFSTCSTSSYTFNVARANTTTTLNAPETDTGSANVGGGANPSTLGITAVVQSTTLPSNGTSPSGTVTFNTATPKTVALIPGFDPNGNAIATASTTVGQNDIPSGGNIHATYNPNGDVNYNASTSASVPFFATVANQNSATVTTFTVTDNYGTYPSTGSYPNTDTPSFPAQDSLTLNLQVSKAVTPNLTVFLVYANGVQLTPPVTRDANGFVTGGGLPIPASGKISFTVPQQNGYLALPSGQVQFTVVYDGWIDEPGQDKQSDPSSANQIVTIVDDRTSADFSLQSDTTVNQQNPLTGSTTQATYNLRLTSIYNFVSAYASTPINLGCTVVSYTSPTGVRSTPGSGVSCGFNPGDGTTPTAASTSVTFAGNSTTSGFITLPLYVGPSSGYGVSSNTLQPATRWWLATGGTTLACIFLLGVPARRRKWQSLLGACMLVVVSFGMSGCGATVSGKNPYYDSLSGGTGGSSGNGANAVIALSPGTYMVLVTATSTTNTKLVHTLPVQVVVGGN